MIKINTNWIWYKYIASIYFSYLFAATNNYEDALKYVKAAEETSSEESIESIWKSLQDPKKRKDRHKKNISDCEPVVPMKKIKIEKIKDGKSKFQSKDTTLSDPVELIKPLPQLLSGRYS